MPTNMFNVSNLVARFPGRTIYALANIAWAAGAKHCRWSWIYNAFQRAERAGIITANVVGGRRVWMVA